MTSDYTDLRRPVYRLTRTEHGETVERSHTTSAGLAACILRACVRQAPPGVLYDVLPPLPAQYRERARPTAAEWWGTA